MVAISWNGDEPRFRGMVVLMMTSPGSNQKPTVVFKHPTKAGLVTIPGNRNHELAPGTLNSVLKQAGLKR